MTDVSTIGETVTCTKEEVLELDRFQLLIKKTQWPCCIGSKAMARGRDDFPLLQAGGYE
jgi:hypothetical protein